MAGAGYEDQPVADDPAAVTDQERLRHAFAALLAMGQDRSLPPEALWAGQGRNQLPDARPPLERPPAVGGDVQGFTTPMPGIQSVDPRLEFPTAPEPPSQFGRGKPFKGKGIVAETTERPWELPKKSKKNKGKD